MRVLGISGSLRRDSHNTKLLRAAAQLLPPGAELVIWEELKTIPPFDEDDEHKPADAVERLRQDVAAADAILIATPEYNHSIPGQLKNALDWLSRPFDGSVLRGKHAAVVGASTGLFGAVWAQAETRKVLAAAGARVIDRELPVPAVHQQFDDQGGLAEDELRAGLGEIARELCGIARELTAAA